MRRISWLAAKTGQLLKKDSAPWSKLVSKVRGDGAHTMFVLINYTEHYQQDRGANLWVGTVTSQVQTVIILSFF
jgi:hypothetical protein